MTQPTVTATDDIPTYAADGRAPLTSLLAAYDALAARHAWARAELARQAPATLVDGRQWSLPVVAYVSPPPPAARHACGPGDGDGVDNGDDGVDRQRCRGHAGDGAVWVVGGIHGEEPAGPMALARAVDALVQLSKRVRVVLLPMCNPSGYARCWRYPDGPAVGTGNSVGDSDWLLPQPGDADAPRAGPAALGEARAITSFVVETAAAGPALRPLMSVDLHEDCLVKEIGGSSYVYSQGRRGAQDAVARAVVALLDRAGLPTLRNGTTRFGEPIVDGVCAPASDGSIDELLAAPRVVVGNRSAQGPGGKTAVVIETPGGVPLEQRVAAQESVVRSLESLYDTFLGQW
eukprot:m51a1_g10213 hypothetical protein (347) ;mRNA; r:100030-101246